MESHTCHKALIDIYLLMEQPEIALMTGDLERASEFSAHSVPSITIYCIVTCQVCYDNEPHFVVIMAYNILFSPILYYMIVQSPYDMYLQVQFIPSPLYPSLQVHVYDPGVLVHRAFASQGDCEAHSSTSMHKRGLQMQEIKLW